MLYTLTRLSFTSPLLSSVKRWEHQSRASSKGNRRLTEWSLRGNNRRVGLRGQQKGGEFKLTNWESLLHAAQQQGQESPSCHCWLSPPQSHTNTHPQTHAPSRLAIEGMHWGSGNAISHSVGVGTNLAAESLEGSSLHRWNTASDYSHFVMVWQSEVSHLWAKR